jgi:uncharacterized YccA/Bax inhibitor family protein
MRTRNPMLRESILTGQTRTFGEVMTVQGAVNKTSLLLLLVVLGALWTWNMTPEGALPWMLLGVVGGLILALLTTFIPTWAAITAPLYALLEGFAMGGISSYYNAAYPGIVIQAVGLTFGVLASMLLAYTSGLIKVTDKFRTGLLAATGGICLLYLGSLLLGFVGIEIPFIHEGGPAGIIFSLVVVVIAALNLMLDFDFIQRGAEAQAPKHLEWYAAFGLIVTLIWLYIEILRLLSKLRSRRR